MEPVNTERVGKYLIEIYPDSSPDSPREWDNLGTMVCFHKRYNLGDKHDYDKNNYDSWGEMKEDIIKQENVDTILPLYLYDHGGITMSTSPFHCPWDSGQVGWIFVSKEKVTEEKLDLRNGYTVKDILEGEVKTYDQYIMGDVYGYKVFEVSTCDHGHEHKEELDSCWGYYGDDECMDEAKSVVEYYMKGRQSA